MKSKSLNYQNWLKAAYTEFAYSGPEFSLKALANKKHLPRATFYYHFDNKEHLTDELLQYHITIAKKFLGDLNGNVVQLIPDLYKVMSGYEINARFHQQLLRNNHIDAFQHVYSEINNQVIELLLPVIRNYFDSDKPNSEIFEFFSTLTDTWYVRMNFKNFSVEYMCNLAIDILEHTLGLYTQPKVKSI